VTDKPTPDFDAIRARAGEKPRAFATMNEANITVYFLREDNRDLLAEIDRLRTALHLLTAEEQPSVWDITTKVRLEQRAERAEADADQLAERLLDALYQIDGEWGPASEPVENEAELVAHREAVAARGEQP
jgi:hypothetical protein